MSDNDFKPKGKNKNKDKIEPQLIQWMSSVGESKQLSLATWLVSKIVTLEPWQGFWAPYNFYYSTTLHFKASIIKKCFVIK